MPSTLENTQRLFRAGRYVDILAEFSSAKRDIANLEAAEHRILIAHTLLQTGSVRRAVEIVERELAQNPPLGLRAHCEVIKGLAFRHNAKVTEALHHYQLALHHAKQQDDQVLLAWAALQRFRLLVELHSSDELSSMLADMRRIATRAGDPHAMAYMHYAVALMEASNGRPQEARRHLNISHSLIESFPNAWLEQLNLIAAFFLDFIECNYRDAIAHLDRARGLLTVTGSRERTLIESNLGHALLVTGRLQSAAERFRSVVQEDVGLARLGAMEGLARVYLADGRLSECENTLDAHDSLLAQDEHLTAAFAGRWTAATRIKLLLRKGSFDSAVKSAATFIKRASELNDKLLVTELTCLQAEALVGLHKREEAARVLSRLNLLNGGKAGGRLPEYFSVRAKVVTETDLAVDMFRRANRVWEDQGNQCALAESNRVFEKLGLGSPSGNEAETVLAMSALSSALMLAHNPRLLAACGETVN